jgi:hypothetical protein
MKQQQICQLILITAYYKNKIYSIEFLRIGTNFSTKESY